jgi:hypothetical protein
MAEPEIDNPSSPAEQADIRPQRPRPAPPQPATVEPPGAWNSNRRARAILWLAVEWLLFVAACLFFSRATTWDYFSLSESAYASSLADLMLAPHVDIYEVTEQAAVIALLLAIFVATPIVVSQFFGRPWALLFLVPLAVVAHLPLLAGAELIAVWVARPPALGVTNRVLLGLISLLSPAVTMWYSAVPTRELPTGTMAGLYLHLPWVAAIAGAAVTLTLFWPLAKLIRYRAILCPLWLALTIGCAVVVFAIGVGQDEVDFRRLDADFALASPTLFQPTSADTIKTLTAERDRARLACEKFLQTHPSSRYTPHVLYRLGRTLDCRFFQPADGKLVVSADTPVWGSLPDSNPASEPVWRKLHAEFPRCPLATVAAVRIAQIDLAGPPNATGRFDEAQQFLRQAWNFPVTQPEERVRRFLGLRPREPRSEPLVIQDTQMLFDWLVLVEENRSDQPADRGILSRFFRLDGHDPQYSQNLESLRKGYDGVLRGELEVLAILAAKDSALRIEHLNQFVDSQSARSDIEARLYAMDKLASLLNQQPDGVSKTRAAALWDDLLHSGHRLFAEEAARSLKKNPRPTTAPME